MSKKSRGTDLISNEFSEDLIQTASRNADLIQKKHQQIVNGACEIFFKRGYHPTTIRDIAKSCRMSMGQLYHYISSKDDVLYLVHQHMQKVWYEYLERSKMEKIGDPLKRLTKALQYTLEFMVENKKLIQFVYSESKYLDKRHLQRVLELDKRNVIGFWHKMLKEVNSKNLFKGDLKFFASLIAYLLVFLSLRGWTLKGMSLKQEKTYIIDFILRGLGFIG
ncbi:MAG: TetR/AcrR family transcriptional regulator [Thermodesulfobacteriota bacterium]